MLPLYSTIKKITTGLMLLLLLPIFSYSQRKLIIQGEARYIGDSSRISIMTIYPVKTIQKLIVQKDTSYVINHKFTLGLNVSQAEMYEFKITGKEGIVTKMLFLQPGVSKIVIKDSLFAKVEILGNQAGIEHQMYLEKVSFKPSFEFIEIRQKIREAKLKNDTATFNNFTLKKDSVENFIRERGRRVAIDWIKNNPKSPINSLLLQGVLYPYVSDDTIRTLYKTIPSNNRNNSWGREIEYSINNLNIGKRVPSFLLKDTSGKLLSLNEIKADLILIDFWASWCIPCRIQSRKINELQDKFSKDQLQVIAISLDENINAWKAAVLKDSLKSFNLSDLLGFDGIAKKYKIKSIPANFLISRNRIIVKKNLPIDDNLDALLRSFLSDKF